MKPGALDNMTTLYGIKNCDTVKKARKWLEQNNIDHRFHDFRADGLGKKQLEAWVDQLGWETLVNKRSTTWKALDDSVKHSLDDTSVVPLILESPTLIKRPLLEKDDLVKTGFKAADYQNIFS